MNILRHMSLAAGVGFVMLNAASAQVLVRPGVLVSAYCPGTAFSAQVNAEANMLRAYGEAAVDFEQARNLRAQAAKMEIQNYRDYTAAYWEVRSRNEAERLKRRKSSDQQQKKRNEYIWKRLKDYPELQGNSVPAGTALNFLLDRLAGSVLAYQSAADTSPETSEVAQQLVIDGKVLHQLRVRQDLRNGERTIFRVDDGIPLDVGWWPVALRGTEFDQERKDFQLARSQLSASSKSQHEENLQKLMDAYNRLYEAFHRQQTRSVRLKSTNAFNEYNTAKRFLQSLAGELFRVRTIGPEALQNDSLRFQGKDLVSLLTHMSRNGLEFAPCQPGEEAAYHQVFHMMRDLYCTVADDQADAKK